MAHNIQDILNYATLFRCAIENTDASDFATSPWFVNFPCGCCGDSSDLLSKFLFDKGFETNYVWGMYRGQSHAWLEYHDYYIDITADQFNDIEERVLLTQDKVWHSKFEGRSRPFRDFTKEFNNFNKARLCMLYNSILRNL